MLILYSCNPTKHLKPDELFLKKNKVKIDTRKLDADAIEGIVKQNPNRKILNVFRYHLGIYNLINKKGATTFKSAGEPPVAYDSTLTKRTVKEFKLYCNNKGYFDANITYDEKIKKNKVRTTYIIESGTPYLISTVEYKIADEGIKDLMIDILLKSHIRTGKVFDVDILDKERERIKKQMRNEGYYYFNKEYVKFKVDSTVGNKQIAVQIHINKRRIKDEKTDSIYQVPHKKYEVNNINMFISKSFKDKSIGSFDTTSFKQTKIHFDGDLKYRPRMLNHAVGFRKEKLYQLEDQQSTYRHLSELGLFKNVNITFDEIDNNQLNANIFLTTALKKSFSIEGIGTNNGGNLGVEGNLIYFNKNLFRGGEKFTIKLNGGLEVQQLINEEQKDFRFLGLPFNTLEFGPEVNLEFPRFLLPVKLDKFSRRANPKTNLNLLLNYQKRPEYERNLTQVTFGYFWNESAYKKHFINPINISVINLNPTTEFEQKLNEENNPFILNSFQDHFINSTSYSFIYNNQRLNKIRDFVFFRFNIEFAGNIQSGINSITNKPYDNPESQSYNMFNIRYAQFIKTDIDIRRYEQTKTTAFVSRINIGVGKPYGNLDVLPFEKSYYGGGANDIRAWQARSLGPGSLADSLTENSLNQIGELKIEGNLEYRFDLTKIMEGAAFIDAGNIWILSEDAARPNAEIKMDRFWQDIAIGVGVGLRLDFNFFLIRFDLAAKLKDPAADDPEKLDLIWNKPTLNLGIGYPF
jgi:outer membrane protein assembly factor BamA